MTSRDPERSTREPNTLAAQYLENSWRCYLATLANYYLVCCKAVRSAVLVIAWLLVRINNISFIQTGTYQTVPGHDLKIHNDIPHQIHPDNTANVAVRCTDLCGLAPCNLLYRHRPQGGVTIPDIAGGGSKVACYEADPVITG